jgi:hypothetical protein
MEPLLLYFKEEFIEFWSFDQNGRLVPILYNSSNKLPLYFLLSGDQIIMDTYAKSAYLQSINGSFGNFWGNVGSSTLKYERFGLRHDFDTLLPYSLKETILPAIIKSHFHNINFSEFLKNKNTFILYDSFVDEEQREIINKYFFEIIGYAPNSITFLNYWEIFRNTQISHQSLTLEESFLFINASLGNIILHLIGKNQSNHVIKKVIEGKGRDPRVDTILDFIAEIAIAKGSQLKSFEIKKELINDGPIVLDLLKEGLVIYTIKNENIGVNPLNIKFHRNQIEGRLNNKQSLNLVQNEFDVFRRANNADQLSIFLIGNVINQPVFVEFFKNTYSKVFPETEKFENVFLEEVLKKCNSTTLPNNLNGNPPSIVPPIIASENKTPPIVKPVIKMPPTNNEIKEISKPSKESLPPSPPVPSTPVKQANKAPIPPPVIPVKQAIKAPVPPPPPAKKNQAPVPPPPPTPAKKNQAPVPPPPKRPPPPPKKS